MTCLTGLAAALTMDSGLDAPFDDGSSDAETSSLSDVSGMSSSSESLDGDDEETSSTSSSTDTDATADEDELATSFPAGFAICTRKGTDRGLSTFEIVGPVLGGYIDASAFTHVVSVRAHASFSCREVYARACTRLVHHGMYSSLSATYLSVRLVGRNINVAESEASMAEPSWDDVEPDTMKNQDARKVLCKAKSTARASGSHPITGRVTVMSVIGAIDHPWRLHAQRARDRRVARHAIGFYRRRVSQIVRRDVRVVRAIGAGACARLRRALELEDRVGTSRARRDKVSHGRSMPKVLPSRSDYAAMKRRAVEVETGVPHRLWTFDANDVVKVWTFVTDSASASQRMYSGVDGRRMRLVSSGTKRTMQGYSRGGNAAPDDEHLAFVVGDDDDLLADLRAATTSYLVSMDGNERLKVAAVHFDGCSLVQRAIDFGLDSTYTRNPQSASNVITIAADGGPVCRRTLTVVTVTLAAEYLIQNQSPLMPMVYILSGEESLHKCIGHTLQHAIKDVMDAHYTVPWTRYPRDDETSREAPAVREIVAVRPAETLRLVGDFCMIHHLLGLTGGSDKLRCPAGWPCRVLMHPSDSSWSLVRPRTVAMVLNHWEQTIWSLSRWCALRPAGWVANDGVVGVVCRGCKHLIPYQTDNGSHLICREDACPMFGQLQAETLPTLPRTVMADALRAARRIFGGVRGPPAVPNVPIVAQDPVLHCTSDIAKKLVYMHIALLTRTEADVARLAVHELEGKTNMGSLYGREFRSLVAKILARPEALGAPIDSALLQMLALSQLLAASWRMAVGRGSQPHREAAAAVMELAAKLLSPLFATFKPLDPETSDRGVRNLYLHTAAAHARSHVGLNAPPVPLVSDDDIEGVIHHLNTYFKTRTSNVSRVEALTDMHALSTFVSSRQAIRFVAESSIYTSSVCVCSCVAALSPVVAADMAVAETLAEKDEVLSVRKTPGAGGRMVSVFKLPKEGRETNASILAKVASTEVGTIETLGLERRVALALVKAQATINVCMCGQLGGEPSRLANVVLPAAAAAAAVVATAPSEEEEPDVSAATSPMATTAGVPSRAQELGASAGTAATGTVGRGWVIEPLREDTVESEDVTGEADFMCDGDAAPSAITGYLPSASLRQIMLTGGDGAGSLPGTMAAALRAEMTMLEMLVRRTHTEDFAQWCDRNHTDLVAIRGAAESVRTKLVALLARCTATAVLTV